MKKYIFGLITMVFAIFAFENTSVFATEGTGGEVEQEPAPVLEMVVINANSSGVSSEIHSVVVLDEVDENGDGLGDITGAPVTENKQFTRTRDITITINISEDDIQSYDSRFDICEIIPEGNAGNIRQEEKCSFYMITEKTHNFQLSGRGDGEKEIKVYFYSNYENKAVKDTITKKIVLDTTGPSITLNGGEYIYIPVGETYTELNATCVDDSLVVNGTCSVVVGDAKIDKKKSGFQYIRYTATDFLGNEVNVLRKVMVEIKTEEKGIDLYWYFAGGLVLIVAGFLAVKVIKNKDEQKNQSVL